MDEEFYCIEENKPEVMGVGFLVFVGVGIGGSVATKIFG
jgi:hypothetical protein